MALSARHRNGFFADISSWDMALLEYLPLTESKALRLINIHHAPFDAPMTVDIFHSTLQQETSVAFDALSYVWGSPDNPKTINVRIASRDGAIRSFDVSVTQNLATALRHLRHPDMGSIVWADAICIKQNDYDERAQQILMMGDIYRSARNVVAFLGPAMDNSPVAMNLINNISCSIEVDFGSGLVKPRNHPGTDPGWANMEKPLDIERDHVLALSHLVHREWFERVWIRQEIGLGESRTILLCGQDSVKWLSFCRGVLVLSRRPIAVSGGLARDQLDSLQDRIGVADTVALYSKRSFSFTNLRRQIAKSKCSD